MRMTSIVLRMLNESRKINSCEYGTPPSPSVSATAAKPIPPPNILQSIGRAPSDSLASAWASRQPVIEIAGTIRQTRNTVSRP